MAATKTYSDEGFAQAIPVNIGRPRNLILLSCRRAALRRQLRRSCSRSLIRRFFNRGGILIRCSKLLAAQTGPAVHVKDLARDVLRPLRSEKDNRQRHVVSGRNPSQRNSLSKLLLKPLFAEHAFV